MAILKALGTGGQLLGGAVAVAVVAAGGYVAYERMSGDPERVETETAAPAAEVTPDTAPSPGDAADAADPAEAEAPAPPRFDLVRVDPEGSAVVAGQAPPQTEIAVLVDGEEAAVSTAGSDGGFVAMFDLPPSARARVITLAMRRDPGEPVESEEQVLIAATSPPQPPIAEDMAVARAPGLAEAPEVERDRPEPGGTAADEPAAAHSPALATPGAHEPDRAPGTDPPTRPDTGIGDGAEPETPASDDPVVARAEPAPVDVPSRGDPTLAQAQDIAESEPETDAQAPGRPAATHDGMDAPAAPAPAPDGAEARVADPVVPAEGTLDQHLSPDAAADGATPGADATDPPAVPRMEISEGDPTRPEESETAPIADPEAETPPARAASDASEEIAAHPREAVEPAPAEPAPAQQPEASPPVAEAQPADDVEAQPAAPAPEAADTAPAGPDAAPPAADPDAAPGHEMAGPADGRVTPSGQAPAMLITGEGGVRLMPAPEAGAPPDVMDNVVIDAISYTPEGAVRLSGRSSGAGDGAVRLYLDNRPLASALIGPEGIWETELPDVDTGVYALRADELDAAGAVVSRFETPFRREAPEQLARVSDAPSEGARADILTVQPGYTLWGISRRTYGRGILYVQVFEANRDQIADPDLIYPGQVFSIPEIPQDAVEALP